MERRPRTDDQESDLREAQERKLENIPCPTGPGSWPTGPTTGWGFGFLKPDLADLSGRE
jgi:hypothetical protein